jgi:GNAT superfamily N-acetyltransferase
VSFQPRTHQLKDGSNVVVRPIESSDEPRLHDAFSRMSERSVYFRFFSPLKRLPEELAHRLARVDYEARFALVALDAQGRIAGVARYDRVAGTDTAEVAVAVVDAVQRKGLGGILLGHLARVAREHGIAAFTLIVLPENRSMLDLLRRLGWIHQARLTGGVYEIRFELGELDLA